MKSSRKNVIPPSWSFTLISYIEHAISAPLTDLLIQKLAGDASARCYWRLQTPLQRWILVETQPFAQEGERYPYINVQRHLAAHDVHVPQIYQTSAELGLLLVEDFGDNTLEKIARNITPKEYAKYYFLALDELFKIHFDASQKSDCVAFSLDFDIEKLSWELNFTKTHLFENYLKHPITPLEQKTLAAFFKTLCTHLADQPKYFTHRDYHSRNLMLHKGRIGVLDFQDARMGTCHYDLASLCRDSYVRLPENLVDELLNYYIYEKERREKTKIDKAAFRHTFDWMSLQRNLKAMGTFAYLHLEKQKSDYLNYILPTFSYVDETLKKFPEFKDPHQILQQYMHHFRELQP